MIACTSPSDQRPPVGLLGTARNTTLGWCSRMAASMAGKSRVRSSVSGTPTKRAWSKRAAMSK
ncbi:hypothetical protein D3C72_2444900 [compost metagenome]